MARTVWKFPIEATLYQEVRVGTDPRIVHVGMQDDEPHMWVEHEAPQGLAESTLGVGLRGTGDAVPDGGRHAGVFMTDGVLPLVFHVYDLGTLEGASDER